VTPCGGCRQRIAEFATPETVIHVCDKKGVRKSFTIAELLPAGFDKGNLKASGKG
jgi:cytidine deaminase